MAALAALDERSRPMKRSQFSEEQIVYALRQAEACTPIRICAASSASVTPPSMRGKRSTPHLVLSLLRVLLSRAAPKLRTT